MRLRGRILVVDNEATDRCALCELLRDEGYEVESAPDAFKALARFQGFAPDIVLTDLKMPGMDGVELLGRLKASERAPATVVMTAFSDVTAAVQAMRAGAAGYLAKPIDLDELRLVLQRELEHLALRRERQQLRERVRDRFAPRNIVGSSPAMSRIFQIVEQVGPSRATVLITGESGTGKDLIASAIHQRSPRASGPFIKLHGAALAELQMADGGTLFLDEIGESSPSIQVKLLRFLQEHELERVGSGQPSRVDVRVLAATRKDLRAEVAAGRFREDLHDRLNVVALEMPSLRDRRSDIAPLIHCFLDRYARQHDRRIEHISSAAMEAMMKYGWPGNVRELENAIERAVITAAGGTIEASHLPPAVRPATADRGTPMVPGASIAELEKYAIRETLRATGGSTSRAAEILGISVRTLQYRLQAYSAASPSSVAAVTRPAPVP